MTTIAWLIACLASFVWGGLSPNIWVAAAGGLVIGIANAVVQLVVL
jgi:branched-subunit amino acid ABC-type transport system permease component